MKNKYNGPTSDYKGTSSCSGILVALEQLYTPKELDRILNDVFKGVPNHYTFYEKMLNTCVKQINLYLIILSFLCGVGVGVGLCQLIF